MKKVDQGDWSLNSKPLIKSPQNQEMNIYSKVCELCGKQVMVRNNKVMNHNCVKNGRKFGSAQ
jgi:hypothetical protein